MNTIYEILLYHDKEEYAEQAANAAFNEIDRLELELSRFRESSDISGINALRQNEAIILGKDCYQCLQQCMALYRQTKGAFDISAGFLIDLWKKLPGELSGPDSEIIEEILKTTGLSWLHLQDDFRVQLMSPEIRLDLGGFGKGYALGIAAGLLQEWGISNGLINAGMSSILPLSDSVWRVAIRHPLDTSKILHDTIISGKTISGSGIRKGQHIIDPRTGYPVLGKLAAWAVADDPGFSDALSTAFMIMSIPEIESYCRQYGTSAMIITSQGKIIQTGVL